MKHNQQILDSNMQLYSSKPAPVNQAYVAGIDSRPSQHPGSSTGRIVYPSSGQVRPPVFSDMSYSMPINVQMMNPPPPPVPVKVECTTASSGAVGVPSRTNAQFACPSESQEEKVRVFNIKLFKILF